MNNFSSGRLRSFSAVYSVVVFPLPVGPVTRMMPFGSAIRRCKLACVASSSPSFVKSSSTRVRSRIPHHDTFAEHCRQCRNANVDLDAADHGLDAAVLRQSPLGDIELGHDLYSGCQRSAQGDRDYSLLLQKSVDSISNRDRVASGLDVHVGCTTLDRLRDNLVHEPNDRRFVGDISQPLDVEFAAIATSQRDAFTFLAVRLATGVLIEHPQGAFDFCRSNHGEIDPYIEHIADCLGSFVDEGIGGCDQQASAVEPNRQDSVGLEKGELQSISQNGLFRDICGVDHRKTAIGRVGNAKIAFGNETELYQDEIETLGGCLRSPPRPANGGRIDQVFTDKQVGKGLREASVPGRRKFGFPTAWCGPGVAIAGFRMTFARSAVSRGLYERF